MCAKCVQTIILGRLDEARMARPRCAEMVNVNRATIVADEVNFLLAMGASRVSTKVGGVARVRDLRRAWSTWVDVFREAVGTMILPVHVFLDRVVVVQNRALEVGSVRQGSCAGHRNPLDTCRHSLTVIGTRQSVCPTTPNERALGSRDKQRLRFLRR